MQYLNLNSARCYAILLLLKKSRKLYTLYIIQCSNRQTALHWPWVSLVQIVQTYNASLDAVGLQAAGVLIQIFKHSSNALKRKSSALHTIVTRPARMWIALRWIERLVSDCPQCLPVQIQHSVATSDSYLYLCLCLCLCLCQYSSRACIKCSVRRPSTGADSEEQRYRLRSTTFLY